MLHDLVWPVARLADALSALTRHARIGTLDAELSNPLGTQRNETLPEWVNWAAKRLGCEAEPAEMSFGSLEQELSAAYPALLRLNHESFLLVLGANGGKLRLLAPSGSVKRFPTRSICDKISEPMKRAQSAQWERLLDEAAIPERKKARTLDLLISEQLANKPFDQCWILRAAYGAETGRSAFRMLREAQVLPHATALTIAKAGQYVLWLASWAVLGRLSFSGHMDRGWLAAWALLLLTLIPFQAATTWLQGLFAIGLGGFLKRRLLHGAMQLDPQEMRHWGIGTFLGQALEAGALETLAVSGGIAGLLGVVELAVSAFLLGPYAAVLGFWCVLAAFLAWRLNLRWQRCTASRMELTLDLISNMVGHRTRIVQQRPAEWHKGEDAALQEYLDFSRRLDRAGLGLAVAIPRGWLLVGMACLLPSFIAVRNSTAETAILLGGVLLSYTAFRKLTASFSDIAVAWVAWKRIRPLFDAAAKTQVPGGVPAVRKAEPGQNVIEADALTFRYRATGSPALRGCNLTIRKGERILLEGPSGGGKTTFASILAGLRQPESGLLLANGLDRHTHGDSGWHRCIAAAPQFHENHILTETLAFNVLMGRCWPPAPGDLKEAESVCRELGLSELLDRMPSGMFQMVGEGGWQLSHGEKSRVYIARALLQNAELVILDESFAALDPENLRLAMECTLRRAETVMVIAHP